LLLALWTVRAFQLMPLLISPPQVVYTFNSSEDRHDWASVRGDASGTGWSPESTLEPPFSTRWQISTPGKVLGTPAAVGDRLFIATEDGLAISLDADTSKTAWTYDIGSPSDSAPAVAGSFVYLGTRDHRVLALDRITGDLRWERNLENIVLGSPIVSDGTLYIGSTNGNLEALDASTGEPRWSAEANGWVVAHPATDGAIVAATSLGERFVTVDPDTGRRRLVFYSGTPVAGGPVIADGRAFFVTNRGGVWAVDPSAISRPFSRFAYVAKFNFFAWRLRSDPPRQTGTRWVGSARGRVKHSPAYAGGNLLVVNESSKVTAFGGPNGSVAWEAQLDGEVIAEPVVAGGTLILGTADGRLHGLNVATGSTEWIHDTGGLALSAAPSVSDRTLYLPSTDGRLVALEGR
jgi:outer membrane protein assembly factor BamB